MRRSWLVRLAVAVASFVACCGSYADAHPLGNFTINHLTVLRMAGGTLDVRYVLDVAEIPSVTLDRTISANGSPSAREYAAWARRHAAEIVPQLEVRADGIRLPLRARTAAAASRPGAAGLRTIRMTAEYSARIPEGSRSVTYADGTERGRLGWRDVALSPAIEPTHELRQYPNALIGSPRTRTTLALQIDAAGAAHAVADAGALAAAGAPSAARSNALSELLGRQNGGPLVLFGALLVAVALGALHALEPGHGKTLLAVSLVGARATPSQALILASSLTIAHTLGVLVLGGVVLYATRWIVPEAIYPWVTLLSGVLVAVVAARALNAAVRAQRPREHQHVHAHDHAHPHAHEHAHGIGVEEHHHHDHERAHFDDEAHARAHAVPGAAPLTFRSAVLAAASGNIAPCPAALVVLLAAIALHQIAFGLGLIVAFSVGLAATLTVLGVAVVRGAAWLAGRPQFERVARFAPLLSATVIAVIGAVMIGEGMVGQGVPAPAVLIAALALVAIAGYAFMLPHGPARGRTVHA